MEPTTLCAAGYSSYSQHGTLMLILLVPLVLLLVLVPLVLELLKRLLLVLLLPALLLLLPTLLLLVAVLLHDWYSSAGCAVCLEKL